MFGLSLSQATASLDFVVHYVPKHSWYFSTVLCRHDGCRCPGSKYAYQAINNHPGVGVTELIPSAPLFSKFFESYHNTVYLWNVTFIFGRCRRSLAAVISAKYGCDLKVLTCAFAWSKFFLLEKLTNGALVTPTSGGSTVISVLHTLFLHNQPWIWP